MIPNKDKIPHTHCCYCRRRLDDNTPHLTKTIEHFIPKSKGGLNGINLLECCNECNTWKADKMPDIWAKQVERHLSKQIKKGEYSVVDYRQIIGSIRHWVKHFKGKSVGVYKF